MPTYLLLDDALRSYELRHEIGEAIVDPLVFIEHDGRRIALLSDLEVDVLKVREDVVDEVWSFHDLGIEELIRQHTFPFHLVYPELAVRALEKLGTFEVVVPPSFQVLAADYIRDKGIDVKVDPDVWVDRRRRKTPWELEGIERAQRAAETAMLTAARMLRDAETTAHGELRFEGEILTAELIRAAMQGELLNQGTESEVIMIHSGDACLTGHEVGHGPILPDRSCIIDCFPRDRRTGVYADMTRTFVPGRPSEELRNLFAHCRKALDIAFDSIGPGRHDAFANVAEYFHSQGFPTTAHHQGDRPLEEGFRHGLGHGVGLQVHERPYLSRRSDELREGDVVAIEPGLYFRGIGGVRLEDTVLVAAGGLEHLTDPYPYDLEP